MDHLDDLPTRHASHRIEAQAVAAFDFQLSKLDGFTLQVKDQSDYGSDAQIEVADGDKATNVRVHVQIKGTERAPNADGTISIAVRRETLNYLLAQPHSFFVCYHVPTGTLRFRSAESVLREYRHSEKSWTDQQTLTVHFSEFVTEASMEALARLARSEARASRNARVAQVEALAEDLPDLLLRAEPALHVPADPARAAELLESLSVRGQDSVISAAFDQFAAALGRDHDAMIGAYMAEINLGMARRRDDHNRIAEAIELLRSQLGIGRLTPTCLHYSMGNGYTALGRDNAAIEAYRQALEQLLPEDGPDQQAMIHKNLGASLAANGHDEEALAHFREALSLDPLLAEAHYALALHHHRRGDHQEALVHLDQVIFAEGSLGTQSKVAAWRINVLFCLGDFQAAFRDINMLLSGLRAEEGNWSWCAQQVSNFGRTTPESAKLAAVFWQRYQRARPECARGQAERLLNTLYLHAQGLSGALTYNEFRADFEESIASVMDADAAFLWDRLGHWAQNEDNWLEAERCFQLAYALERGEYGYCLGVALNELDRSEESLPLLLEQAESIQPDAMSWFQVAYTYEKLNRDTEAIDAYKKAIELDPEDAQAWFNMGGVHWNADDTNEAQKVWNMAIARFPDHELASKARLKLMLFL
jgi:tetratricopeptide (TPR) repeat protein